VCKSSLLNLTNCFSTKVFVLACTCVCTGASVRGCTRQETLSVLHVCVHGICHYYSHAFRGFDAYENSCCLYSLKPTTTLSHALHAGHVNFNDEVTAAMRLADGLLLCVDAAEGLMVVAERAIKQAVLEGLPITLMITKVCVSVKF